MFAKTLAFLKKDFLMESSYRMSFFFNIFGILVSILNYYFIDKLFGSKLVPHLSAFGVNYFSYVLLSTAFFGYVGVGLGSFSERIRAEQRQGTLEVVLLSPTRASTILFSLVFWNLILATIDMLVYIALAVFLFKMDFTHINIFSTIVIFILTIAPFSALGIISASFIMIFKQGNPVGWILGMVEGLIGGVYFPITVLPHWLQVLAKVFPITYAIEAIQLAVHKGYSLDQLWRQTGILLLFSIILLPLSLLSFTFSLRKARKDGSLGQY
ncbi:MAG: ABC transporter permease [Candidatus Omnitrophota bacterium]